MRLEMAVRELFPMHATYLTICFETTYQVV